MKTLAKDYAVTFDFDNKKSFKEICVYIFYYSTITTLNKLQPTQKCNPNYPPTTHLRAKPNCYSFTPDLQKKNKNDSNFAPN